MGCTPKTSYDRNTEMGTITTLTFDEAMKKIENKETFMFAFTMEECGGCLYFKENVLSKYIKNHGFEFNEVSIEKEEDSKPIFDFVEKHPNPEKYLTDGHLPTDVLTPTLYFVENGEVKDIYVGAGITEDEFDQLIQKYQLDKVKE